MANQCPGSNSRLVYSTDGGRVRDVAPGQGPRNRPQQQPAKREPQMPNDGVVRLMRDKKGRGGKTATSVFGLPGDDAALDAMLKQLKTFCGTGGTRDGRTLVLQGDQRERLLPRLEALGYKVKIAGG